ncbi:MAG: hypothetical protein MJ055_00640 [Phascolarctobacterium sp.]|nr:hypothetical protein [Phascolarctobacterium sp.]
MKRYEKITVLSLLLLFVCAITAWAAMQHKVNFKYRLRGLNATLQEQHINDRYCDGHYAKLVNSKNKTIFNWPVSLHYKPHKIIHGDKKYDGATTSYWNYKFNTYNMAPGKYIFRTHCYYGGNSSYVINYKGQSYLKYRTSKIIRQNNGDLVQRFYLSRNRMNNKVIHVQIFNSNNKLVYSLNRKSNNSTQDFTFNWNGWPSGTSANKCPKGVYTLKYWADGINPKVVKFRLAI